ncbi:RHS repeat domain-containing protein [Sulfurirhabdus autotrophica]|uniref:RHS repeat-associated protein n=1 Tax=Sulfurirhabdus autotrophica TaxID=1706046 RepID=A0A4R3XUS0_9PROT|nr:RHS repeat-associated core domain-containing protein [Sulfurirhabdus autotrophica]TCV82702.1 RHS repeat-associated protein [Sulfurirhabdus autotrophica]
MRNHPIPQRYSLAKILAVVLLVLAQVIASAAHGETITYQHDNNGNITQRGATTYTYDPLNRVETESGPAKTQTFKYDANGNRLSDGAGTYTYALTSNRMLTRRGLSVTTDAVGNITADGTGREYVYNQARQLAQVKQGGILIATYTYDHAGLRITKVTTASAPQGAQTVIYEYDEQGHLIAEFSGTGTPIRSYIWLDNAPLSQIEYIPSRKIYYFNVDHLNTPRSLMDDTGKVVWRWESDAFGSTQADEDPDGDGIKMTSNLRFPGQYYDKETGLHYNWHRYYDPTMGQYIQADPVGLAAGTNLYTYVKDNPLNYVDPTGWDIVLPGPVPLIAPPVQSTPNGSKTGQIEWPEGFSPDPKAKGIPTVKTPANFPTKNPVDCDEQLKKNYEQCRNTCESVLSGAACRLKAEFKYFLCKKQTPGSGLSGMGGGLGGDAGL